ncbi:putative transcription factor interactor and regulator CCHC(Zn) family [Helianthus anomalus]
MVNMYKVKYECILKDFDEFKNETYPIRKTHKILKEKVEAQHKDIRRLEQDLSQKSCVYLDAQQKIAELTAELDSVKTSFKENDFHLKKIDKSSSLVSNIVGEHAKFEGQKAQGLGYNQVPPPFNHNYTSSLLSADGKFDLNNFVKPKSSENFEKLDESDKSFKTLSSDGTVTVDAIFKCVNNSDASTSCAEKRKSEKYVPPKPVTQNTKRFQKNKKHAGVNFHEQVQVTKRSGRKQSAHQGQSCPNRSPGSSPQSMGQQNPHRCSRPISATQTIDDGYAKKQTCYNCGTPGHIARNCTHRPYVPYHNQNQRVTPRERSCSKPMKVEKPKAMKNLHPKVKPSDGNWNAAKNKQKVFNEQKRFQNNQKTEKPKVSKMLVNPTPVWKEKSKSAASSVFDENKDMCLHEVSYIDALGMPRTTMAWVPMSN